MKNIITYKLWIYWSWIQWLIYKRNEYPVKDSGINESDSFLIINGSKDQMDSNKLKLIEGKDYSVGDEA